MTITARIRKVINRWTLWRIKRAMVRACPDLRDLDRMQAECRRGHKRGSAALYRAKQEVTNRALAAGIGRG